MTQTPDGTQLDALLAEAGRPPTRDAGLGAALQSIAVRATAPASRRRPRRAGLITGMAGIGLVGALTAGVALSSVWLRTPPFQDLPGGWSRSTAYVPIEWTSPDGEEERCRLYLDLERADADLMRRLDDAIAAHDWSGFGQALYDTLPGSPSATSVEGAVTELAVPIVMDFARTTIPELGGFGEPGDGPAIGALGTTCRTEL